MNSTTTSNTLLRIGGIFGIAALGLILTASPAWAPCLTNVGDFVWEDLNHNGIQDPGEPGINGVTVTQLENGWWAEHTVTANGPDGRAGWYSFFDTCGPDVLMTVDTPPGYAPTTPCSSTEVMAPSDSNCSPFHFIINQTNPTIDFGFVRTGGCVMNTDCDDHDICTTDTCVAGVCQNRVVPNSVCLCADADCPTVGRAGNITATVDANGDVTVNFVESTDINDNSYGTNIVNWPRSHAFGDLVGSDKAQFVFKDASGRVVFDFYLDYITKKAGTPSGYGSLGATGGDGHVNAGQAAWLMSYQTSLANNLNDYGYCAAGVCSVAGVNLLTNSPPTTPAHTGYGLPPAFSQWNFNIAYSVKVSHLAFGTAGFGGVTVPAVHNSPPKCGDNATNFGTCPCSGAIGDFVWNDINMDGLQSAGEPGLGGVVLTLKDAGSAIAGQATTDAGGLYHFNDVCPGSYTVEVDATTLPPGFTPTAPCSTDQTMATDSNCAPAAVDLATDGASNQTIDFGYVGPPIGECVLDQDCDDQDPCTADRCVGGVCLHDASAGATCLCALLDCPDLGRAGTITTSVDGSGDVTIVFAESTGINDNSYGANVVNWPRSHAFKDLVGSDKAQFVLTDSTGRVVLDFYQDYISAKSGTPSGYASLGVAGGDGRVNTGQAAWIMSWQTSLAENLNNTGYCAAGSCTVSGVNLLLNSPPTIPLHTGYGLPAAFNQWNFAISYMVKVSHLAFGTAGFGGVTVPSLHNSPPKCGDNMTTFGPCFSAGAQESGPSLRVQ